MADQITGLNSSDRAILRQIIKSELARIATKEKNYRNPPDVRPWFYAKLTSELTPGTFEDPTAFTFTIYHLDPAEPDPAPLTASSDAADIDIDGVNRWNIQADEGRQIRVELCYGEWTPLVDCPT